ncbi:MAG: hypothetical protein Q9216_002403 [Gyalolechia sp. 2 TL-2023]
MLPKYLFSFLLADALFAATGALLVAVILLSKSAMNVPTPENVAPNLLLSHTPLNGALADAGLIFLAFLISIPGLIAKANRTWFKVHSWMVLICILVTLVIGLEIWFSTLKTRSNLGVMWQKESPEIQELLQKRFQCCGYMEIPFHKDSTCPNQPDALAKTDCVGPFSNFANDFLDLVFTAIFGMVALDAILLLCGLVVLKKRAEEQRYRHIDEKTRYSRI